MVARHRPPLIAARSFEAAARHKSFLKAAQELNVTPTAVSHQVKRLEDYLGQALFVRLNRAVELTEAGTTLAYKLSDIFCASRPGARSRGA
jgi:LysR family glycine cleavage system transcriptional activator